MFSSPKLVFLGLKPSDLELYVNYNQTNSVPFTARDAALCKGLMNNESLKQEPRFTNALKYLLMTKAKHEIESIYQMYPEGNILRWLREEIKAILCGRSSL